MPSPQMNIHSSLDHNQHTSQLYSGQGGIGLVPSQWGGAWGGHSQTAIGAPAYTYQKQKHHPEPGSFAQPLPGIILSGIP